MIKNLDEKFPLCVFPKPIQEFITAARDSFSFPPAFTGSAIIHAVATAIGNTRVLKFKDGMSFRAILFMALVGESGIAKTPPLSFVYKPLWQMNTDMIEAHTAAMKDYHEKMRNASRDSLDEVPDKPPCKQIIVSDITTESVVCIHKANPRRLCVYSDELANWIGSFNRYRKGGGDEQFWLSVHSGAPICVNRKSSDEAISIPEPFICVIGTIQPGILADSLSGEHMTNGFLYRILQAKVPEDESTKILWNDKGFPPELEVIWHDLVTSILTQCDEEYDVFSCPSEYYYSDDARFHIIDWQNKWENDLEKEGKGEEIELFRKIQTHVHKFALIIQTLREAAEEADKSTVIGFPVALFSTMLCDYYFSTALSSLALIEDAHPATIKKNLGDLYSTLDFRFTTKDAVEKGKFLGIPERTVKRFLKKYKGTLFIWERQGVYTKNL